MRTFAAILSLLAVVASVPAFPADVPPARRSCSTGVGPAGGMAGMALGGNDVLRSWSNPALLSGWWNAARWALRPA